MTTSARAMPRFGTSPSASGIGAAAVAALTFLRGMFAKSVRRAPFFTGRRFTDKLDNFMDWVSAKV